jgi:hypothetical protein
MPDNGYRHRNNEGDPMQKSKKALTYDERNPRQHRLAELYWFEELLKGELDNFMADGPQRKTSEEDDVFRELLKEGIELDVITIQMVADAALTDASAAGRWVKGDTVPAKRKQIKILQEMCDRVAEAREEIQRKTQELQKVLDAAHCLREARRKDGISEVGRALA